MSEELIFAGPGGYARLTARSHKDRQGAVLHIANPTSKVDILPPQALAEVNSALDALEADRRLKFAVLCGAEVPVHAGADINMFAGGLAPEESPPDYAALRAYLEQGTALDLRIKQVSRSVTTVAAIQGERFGGAVEWPLMCSYVVAAPETGIQFSEVNIGFLPGWDGILNAMLKSGPLNALFMGTLGARLDAGQMDRAGIVNLVVAETGKLLGAALDLATEAPPGTERGEGKPLAEPEALLETLAERLDVRRYEALAAEAAEKQKQLDAKELSRHIDKRLAELGRPVAPLAVEAVFGLVAAGARLDPSDADGVAALARAEAERCFALMHTRDRVTGVNSVLKARENPLNKIALFRRS